MRKKEKKRKKIKKCKEEEDRKKELKLEKKKKWLEIIKKFEGGIGDGGRKMEVKKMLGIGKIGNGRKRGKKIKKEIKMNGIGIEDEKESRFGNENGKWRIEDGSWERYKDRIIEWIINNSRNWYKCRRRFI